jgi:hypothetical protein
MALPRSAISSLMRLRSSWEKRYSSRRLRLAEMNHHRWIEWRLTEVAGKTQENCLEEFSRICSTVSSSVKASRCLMKSAANASLTDFAGASVVGLY